MAQLDHGAARVNRAAREPGAVRIRRSQQGWRIYGLTCAGKVSEPKPKLSPEYFQRTSYIKMTL